jgi:hypothetical protein
MKFVDIENYTKGTIVFSQIRGLSFEAGEVKKVHPTTAMHPAVQAYIDNGLRIVVETASKAMEPSAPEQTSPVAEILSLITGLVSEPIATPAGDEISPVNDSQPESNDEPSGNNLRDLYLTAPAVTVDNVDQIITLFPSIEDLKAAPKEAFDSLGLS